MTIELIDTKHPLYENEVDLRVEVLRRPLGMARETVFFPFEDESLHFVALRDEQVVGCVLFHRESDTHGRLFQMAVAPNEQRTGLGRALVKNLERFVYAQGIRTIGLNARQTALGFYERLGYSIASPPYVEVGLMHQKMRKELQREK